MRVRARTTCDAQLDRAAIGGLIFPATTTLSPPITSSSPPGSRKCTRFWPPNIGPCCPMRSCWPRNWCVRGVRSGSGLSQEMPHDVGTSIKDLHHEAFRTSAPTACGEGSPRPHSSPARGLDSVQLLGTEDLVAGLPSGNERARLVGAQARDFARADEDPSPRAGS